MLLHPVLLVGGQSGLVAHLSAGVPKRPGTRLQPSSLQPSGDVVSLLIRPRTLGFANRIRFADRRLLGQPLLAEPVPGGYQVAGAFVDDVEDGADCLGERNAGRAVALRRFPFKGSLSEAPPWKGFS
jgi:hypothetical protein